MTTRQALEAHRETVRLALAQLQADETAATRWEEKGRLLALWTDLNGLKEWLCEQLAALPEEASDE